MVKNPIIRFYKALSSFLGDVNKKQIYTPINEHGKLEMFTFSNSKYIFIHGGFSIAMLVSALKRPH